MLKFTTDTAGNETLNYDEQLEQRIGFHNAVASTSHHMERGEFAEAIMKALRGSGHSLSNIMLRLENNIGTAEASPTDAPMSAYRNTFEHRELMTRKQFERVTKTLRSLMIPYSVDDEIVWALPYQLELRYRKRATTVGYSTHIRAVEHKSTGDNYGIEYKPSYSPMADLPEGTFRLSDAFAKELVETATSDGTDTTETDTDTAPETDTPEVSDVTDTREADLTARETAVTARERAVLDAAVRQDSQQEMLDAREAALDEREETMRAREEALCKLLDGIKMDAQTLIDNINAD